MFDFSLGEMLVVALVALVVLGPERLPKAARFAGLWVRKARAQWYSMKHELEQELASEELRRSLRESQQALRDAEAQLREATADVPRAIAAPSDDASAPAPPADEAKRDD
jgi:sec-independent protein translocase protein TatB